MVKEMEERTLETMLRFRGSFFGVALKMSDSVILFKKKKEVTGIWNTG